MVNIKISGRPSDSISYKMVRAYATGGKDVHGLITHAVETYERAIMAGCEVNPADLWLFCTALKVLAESLEKGMSGGQLENCIKLQKEIGVTTIVCKTRGDDDAT